MFPNINQPADDVIKWKHFPRYWPFFRGIHRSPVDSSHKGQGRGALMYSWANSPNAGDLRRDGVQCDLTVMMYGLGCFAKRVPISYSSNSPLSSLLRSNPINQSDHPRVLSDKLKCYQDTSVTTYAVVAYTGWNVICRTHLLDLSYSDPYIEHQAIDEYHFSFLFPEKSVLQ